VAQAAGGATGTEPPLELLAPPADDGAPPLGLPPADVEEPPMVVTAPPVDELLPPEG
jgi:hypothetical protein